MSLADLLTDVHKTVESKETARKLNNLVKATMADLPTKLEQGMTHTQLVQASRCSNLMFRYTAPPQYLRGGLTAAILQERIAASVHEHLQWMQDETCLELKTSVGYAIAAYERASFRCLLRRSYGLFTFPQLNLLIRIQPVFACNACGKTDVPEKDQLFCKKCETFSACSTKCWKAVHPDDLCAFAVTSINPELNKHVTNCTICSGCTKDNAELRCNRCHAARYCSITCQTHDWSRIHRGECRLICANILTTNGSSSRGQQ